MTMLARVGRPDEIMVGNLFQSGFANSLKLTIGTIAFASVATRVIIPSKSNYTHVRQNTESGTAT
jgi:hypothetical protein